MEQYRLRLAGRFVAGVVHELDNRLSVVLGFSELIRTVRGPEEKTAACAGKIGDAAEAMTAILRAFSLHARPRSPGKEIFSPAAVLREIARFSRYDLERGNVSVSFPEEEVRDPLWGDPRDFGLALLALLTNGSEAMAGPGGSLVLRAERRGRFLRFAVSDRGPGIDPESLPRVFEEGFTTKADPSHAGMGLPVARFLAGEMGGTLSLAADPAGGCVAAIDLPLR